MYNLDAVFECMTDFAEKIDEVKITRFERFGFNVMEGGQYQINFKIVTKKGYQNKLVKVLTNSTYLEDYGNNDNEIKANLIDLLSSELANAMPIENK